MIGDQDGYTCYKGISKYFENEDKKPNGEEEGQVMWAGWTRISKSNCKHECRNRNAIAFNWHSGEDIHGCRCYSEQAAGKLRLKGEDWLYCTKQCKQLESLNDKTQSIQK